MENQHRQIEGYRDFTSADIVEINNIKALEKKVLDALTTTEHTFSVDNRWAAIARTDLEKGFMAYVRSVAKPGA